MSAGAIAAEGAEQAVDDRTNPKRLARIAIYEKELAEMDRLLGDAVSNPKKLEAMLEVIKKERLVDRVRRRLTSGFLDPGDGSGITPVSGSESSRDRKRPGAD